VWSTTLTLCNFLHIWFLKKLKVKKLASRLLVHSINYAAEVVQTKRAFSSTITNSHQEPVSGQSCNLLIPLIVFPVEEEFHCNQCQSGSFSFNYVGSGFYSLQKYFGSKMSLVLQVECEHPAVDVLSSRHFHLESALKVPAVGTVIVACDVGRANKLKSLLFGDPLGEATSASGHVWRNGNATNKTTQ
jgi:hypothetical protein